MQNKNKDSITPPSERSHNLTKDGVAVFCYKCDWEHIMTETEFILGEFSKPSNCPKCGAKLEYGLDKNYCHFPKECNSVSEIKDWQLKRGRFAVVTH